MLVMFILYYDRNCCLLFFRHQQNRPGIPNARKAYDLILSSMITHFQHFLFSFRKKMATNFLDLATTLEYLGAKCLLKKKVNFVPC